MISTRKDLIEKLAELEHDQWVSWSKNVAKSSSLDITVRRRWESLWVPYEELSEEMKEKDRVWARKSMELVEDSYMSLMG